MSNTLFPLVQEKYIVELPTHILTQKGFILKTRINKYTIRIFGTFQYAEEYLQRKYPYIKNYTIKKIKLILEEM